MADGTATTTITSAAIKDASGANVPNGTKITVVASEGTIIAGDIDGTIAGVQVATTGGVISFGLRSSLAVGNAQLTATSVTGDATGMLSVPFTAVQATRLEVTQITNPVAAGAASNVQVKAVNAAGVTATGYTGTVRFTSTDDNATLPSNYTFLAGDAGVKQFISGVTFKTAGTHSVTATDTTTATITGSQTGIVVNPGPATKIVLTANPTTISSSVITDSTLTARILDQNDNLVTSFNGSVNFAVTEGTTAFGNIKAGSTSVAAANGVATSVVQSKVTGGGTITCTASANGLTQGTANVTTRLKELVSIAISSPRTAAPVGETIQFTATGTYDDTSTENLTAAVNWTIESPNPAGAGAMDTNVQGRFNALKQGTAGVKATMGAKSSAVTTVTVNAFNGTITLAASNPSIVANGTSTSTIFATVKTAANANVVDGISVAFALTGGTGSVAPATATAAGGAAHTIYTSATTVGSGTVTASVGAQTGSITVTLTHGPATKITLTANPPTISASTPSESALTATIRDANNNVVTTGSGATAAVTFAVGQTTFGNIKTGETTKNAVAGVATSVVVSKVDPTGGVINCTASANGLSQGTVNVTTVPKELQSIAIEIVPGGKVQTTTPKVGETVLFRATGTYRDQVTQAISTEVITTNVAWNSSDIAKGTIASGTGLFRALAIGATNITAGLGGKTSNSIAMNVQAAAAVVINTANLPITILSGGTIDFAPVVSGGTTDGFNYTIEAGSPAGGIITTAGLFTAGATAGVYTIKVTDKTSGASATYQVKQPFTVTPKTLAFLTTDQPKTFTIAGAPATSTKYTWDIMDSATAATPVTTPADYGTWSNGREVANPATLTNNFAPKADINAAKTFYVRVTIADAGLAAAGLDKVTVGPFTITPVATYTVTVTNAAGAKLSGVEVIVEYSPMVDGKITRTTNADGIATFNLPDTGGNYAYNLSLANYVSQAKISNQKAIPVILAASNLTITGVVETAGGAPLSGATVTAFLPAAPTVQYAAKTASDGSYTINLPTGAATTGWTVVASMPNFISVARIGVALTGGTAAVNFSGAANGLPLKALGAPDVDAGGGEKSLIDVASGQTTEVKIPAGGLAVDGFIAIAQTAKSAPASPFTAGSADFVYQVKLTTDQAGNTPVSAADIKRIFIRLPINLAVVKPGDLEKGTYKIYKATSLANLEAGNVIEIPAANIIQTDYVGNGQIGSVTFWTDRLSFFAVGAAAGAGGTTLTDASSDSRCFIATAAYGSPFEKHVEILRAFRDVYLLPSKLGRLFVETYYSFSPNVASLITDSETLKALVRVALLPAVGLSYLLLQLGVLGLFLILGVLLIGTMALVRRRRSRMA